MTTTPRRLILLLGTILCALSIAGSIATSMEVECDAGNDDGSCDAPDAAADGRRARAKCEDKEMECKHWASMGECENNPKYMLFYCPISCDSCPEPLDLSKEEEDLLDAVANYGVPQKVEVSTVFR